MPYEVSPIEYAPTTNEQCLPIQEALKRQIPLNDGATKKTGANVLIADIVVKTTEYSDDGKLITIHFNETVAKQVDCPFNPSARCNGCYLNTLSTTEEELKHEQI